MNAYIFMTPDEHCFRLYESDGMPVYEEWYVPFEMVFAETRGKARRIFCQEHKLDYMDRIVSRLLERDVDRAPGIAKSDDRYWALNRFTRDDSTGELVEFSYTIEDQADPWHQEWITELRDYPAQKQEK